MTSAQLGFIGVVVYAIAMIAFLFRWGKAYRRGFEDGCAFVRHNVEAENALRNVQPVILEPAEHRLLMEVLRELVLEDHGTIH